MDKDTYINKYVGKLDKRRTNAYVKRGNKVNKYQTVEKKYDGVLAIKNRYDITGYLLDNKIHAAKNTNDHRKKSKEELMKKSKLSFVI